MLLMTKSSVALCIVSAYTISSEPLQPPNGIIALSEPHNLPSSELRLISVANSSYRTSTDPPKLNLTTPDLNSSPAGVDIRCNYGHQLVYNDCIDALNTFIFAPDRNLTVGTRGFPAPYWDLDLPIRWISGELHDLQRSSSRMLTRTASGYCTFDLSKDPQSYVALATGHQLASAALALITKCVINGRGQGGTATNIGTLSFPVTVKNLSDYGCRCRRSAQS